MQYHRSIIQWTIVPNRGAQRSNPSVHREEARRSNTIYSHPLSACCFQTQSDTSHSKSLQCLTERKSPVSKAVGRSHIDPILFQLDRKNPKRHHVSNRNCNQSQIPLFQYIDLSNKSGPLGDIQNRKAHASMTGVTLRSWLNHSLPRTSWLSQDQTPYREETQPSPRLETCEFHHRTHDTSWKWVPDTCPAQCHRQ